MAGTLDSWYAIYNSPLGSIGRFDNATTVIRWQPLAGEPELINPHIHTMELFPNNTLTNLFTSGNP